MLLKMPGKASKKEKQSATPAIQSGSYVFPNGDRYEGEYVECGSSGSGQIERNGVGTHQFSNGIVYCGQWSGDRMNGEGEMKYPSGAVYKGQFVDNEYHGTGVYTWPDGSRYTGDFSHNRLEGSGEFMDSAGRVWTGEFKGLTAEGLRLKLS